MNLPPCYYNVLAKGENLRRLRMKGQTKTGVHIGFKICERSKMTVTELEKCIDLYGKDIYGFCRQITGNREEGEDLYQDTFMKALELKKKIHMDQNPKSYLLSIAIRIWKNRRRKYAWRQRITRCESITEEMTQDRSGEENADGEPERTVLIWEEQELVKRSILSLEERYRIPVYLYYSAELSVKEIAQILKLPEGTVKSRLHKARVMVKERMEADGYDR